jgi:hypothetical protein
MTKHIQFLSALFLIFPVVGSAGLCAEVPGMIGGGNIDLKGDAAKLAVLQSLGAGCCRVPASASEYWNNGKPLPERFDAVVLAAHEHGVTPMFLFEYYTRWNAELGGAEKWHAIGRAFAGRFCPNSAWLREQKIKDWGITTYTAFNEPMWQENNPTPIPPDQYAIALEGLADGVHSIDAKLCVNPGGFQEVPLFQNRDPYIKAVAPLYNSGKLCAIDIHRYWDVQYVPMSHGFDFSLQHQFEQVKRNAGITADVKFCTTEMNFKKRGVSEEEAAAGFLTALWDALTVVGNDGQRLSQFVMPWNIFNPASKDVEYGLTTSPLPSWMPTARGKVLAMVCELTRGMDIKSVDPKRSGVTVLEGGGRKLWVWQNRPGWSKLAGTNFTITDIPARTTTVEIYGWDGLRKTESPGGETKLTIVDLPASETLLFVATEKK